MINIVRCFGIVESSIRSDGSPQKKELIRFITDNLEKINIVEEHMFEWTAEDWIKNIKENNPCVTDDHITDFEDLLTGSFTEYAEQIIGIHLWTGYYELCGVYWYYYYSPNGPDDICPDTEIEGPTTNLDELRDYVGL